MRLKQFFALMMGVVLVFGSLPLSAYAKDNDSESGKYSKKDEAIYGKLGANGALKDMYVVNTFHMKKPGVVTDHGDYTDVRNLSNLTDIKQTEDNNVQFQVEKDDDDFYYQGNLDKKPLPWDIDVTYKLDGKTVDPSNLAGKSGPLELQIKTSKNKDVDPTFFKNYMLQISVKLDPEKVADIQAPDGTEAKSGKNTQVTFTVMPEKEETYMVSGDATDFEMDPIEINATPASMPIDDPDLGDVKGNMQSLADAVKKIDDGVGDLNSGITDLNDGASELSNGSSSYLDGINELDQQSDELINGSAQMNDVMQQVSDAVQGAPDDAPDLSDLQKVPDGIRSLAGGLEDAADGIDELRNNYDDAYGSLEDVMNDIPDYDISQDRLDEILDEDVDEEDQEVINELMETYEAAQKAKASYQEAQEAFDEVTGTLDNTSASVRDMADEANSTATEIENSMDDVDDLEALDDLQSGVTDLASQYQTFHQGLIDYTDGVGELASNYQDIDSGIQGLSDGSSSLQDGSGDLKDGTSKLKKKTSDLPGDTQSEVDDMLDEYDASDFDPVSFVSDKNQDVDLVQFSLKTESIEVDEPDEDNDDNVKDEDKGLWQRFLDLFR